jgi:hypothetical protein
MLWLQMQRIIRLFMVATLVLATIPHTHQTSSEPITDVAEELLGTISHDHDTDDHDHHEPGDQSKAGHSHGPATADHVHDKPFPLEMAVVTPVAAQTPWYLPGDRARADPPCRGLERPPRMAAS